MGFEESRKKKTSEIHLKLIFFFFLEKKQLNYLFNDRFVI